MRQVVKVAVCNGAGEVLILRRSMNDTNAGQWETPGGGIDEGETPTEAAIREVHEEAGILLDKVYPQGKTILSDDETGEQFEVHFFRAWLLLGQRANIDDNDDHDAFEWQRPTKCIKAVDSWTKAQLEGKY